MSRSLTVATATAADLERCVRVLTDAFRGARGGLPEWLVPDAARRRVVYRDYWTILAEYALRPGSDATVETIGDSAVAFWYPAPAGGEPELVPDDYEHRLARACGADTPRFTQLDEASHAYPGLDTDWMYLGFLAVAPDAQGAGLGTTLLAHRHRALDRTGTPAFLVASSADSARLYRSLGYRDHGEPVGVPGAPWRMYPMVRRG